MISVNFIPEMISLVVSLPRISLTAFSSYESFTQPSGPSWCGHMSMNTWSYSSVLVSFSLFFELLLLFFFKFKVFYLQVNTKMILLHLLSFPLDCKMCKVDLIFAYLFQSTLQSIWLVNDHFLFVSKSLLKLDAFYSTRNLMAILKTFLWKERM